jgi:AcrR family transcriptional regulator
MAKTPSRTKVRAKAASNGDDQQADGRRRILDAAIQILESDGEAALRVLDIARMADVVPGLINHHFGGRDQLVAAAQLERFAGESAKDQDRLRRILDEDPSREDVRAGLRQISGDVVSRRRATKRLSRIAIIGSAHGRPELTDELGEPTSQLIGRMAEIVEVAQQAGHVRADLDARAIATFVQAYGLGFVLADLDPDSPSSEALEQVILAALEGFLTPE